MIRIHIVGSGPRTGTTLLTELMSTCFEIDLFTEHEDSIYKLPPKKCEIYLTKKPSDIPRVKSVLEFMSNLYVIYLIRDPRDMVVSRHNSDPTRYWSGLKFWNTYTVYGRELADHPRFITLRYEDLVSDPNRIQNELMSRLPFLKKKSDFSQYHEIANPSKRSLNALRSVRPISSSSIGNWRNHLPRIAGQLQLHGSISDDLIFYGYENDRKWEEMLEGVTPDLSPSRWPEYFDDESLQKIRRFQYTKAIYVALGHSRFYGPITFTRKTFRFCLKVFSLAFKGLRKGVSKLIRCILPAYKLATPSPAKQVPLSRNLIIKSDMLPSEEGANINVPSIIRVPDWVKQPIGRYYLYFASHTGARYIRLAFADDLKGPWKIHPQGTIHTSNVSMIGDYIFAPDVHIDHERKKIRMYFHSITPAAKKFKAFVATSDNGLDFDVITGLADTFYFRAFSHQGVWYALSKGGRLFRSGDGLSEFIPGPDLFPVIPNNSKNYDSYGSVRHVSIETFSDYADIYYTRIGDSPERILKSRLDFAGDWKTWRAGPPQEVMRAVEEWEGANLPIKPSIFGKTTQPVHQLRDPEIFIDEDGSRYLLYAAAGEHGIGLARLD